MSIYTCKEKILQNENIAKAKCFIDNLTKNSLKKLHYIFKCLNGNYKIDVIEY